MNQSNILKRILIDLNLDNIDEDILKPAFTHPSFKNIDENIEHYERLEFLGDAVIDLITADELYNLEIMDEGEMTEKRKLLVSNKNFSNIFDILGFSPIVIKDTGVILSIKDKANIVEAFFGVIFVCNGYKKSKEVWNTIQAKYSRTNENLFEELKFEKNLIPEKYRNFYDHLKMKPKNARSLIQELSQKQGLPIPKYIELERTGPDHNRSYLVSIIIRFYKGPIKGTYRGIGRSSRIKSAELKAAENLCDQIFLPYVPSDND